MMELNLEPLLVVDDFLSVEDPLFSKESEFIMEAVKSNHEILRFSLKDKHLGPCRNCHSCFTKEVPCSFLDDFNSFATSLMQVRRVAFFLSDPHSISVNNLFSKSQVFLEHQDNLSLKSALLVLAPSNQENIPYNWEMFINNCKIKEAQVLSSEEAINDWAKIHD